MWTALVDLPQVKLGVLRPVEAEHNNDQVNSKGRSRHLGKQEPTTNAFVECKPAERLLSRAELAVLYGDDLRMAVDKETCWLAITGSHARVSGYIQF